MILRLFFYVLQIITSTTIHLFAPCRVRHLGLNEIIGFQTEICERVDRLLSQLFHRKELICIQEQTNTPTHYWTSSALCTNRTEQTRHTLWTKRLSKRLNDFDDDEKMRQNKCARHRDRTETAKIYKSNPRLYLFDSAQPHTPTYSTWELRTNKRKENLATKNVTTTPTPMSTILEESIDRKALRAFGVSLAGRSFSENWRSDHRELTSFMRSD